MKRKQYTVNSKNLGLEIRKTIRGAVPHVPFAKIARDILGRRYSLSLVLCGDTLAQALNKKYRKKKYSPNVLSFPYSKNDGEIVLNVRKAAREARGFGSSATERTALLFIHGCLHLRGLDHGNKMDALEQKFLKQADASYPRS